MAWVEKNYQISVKYQILHKQVHYRMKAKLKVSRPASIKKDNLPNYRVKKKVKKITLSLLVVGV